MCVCVCDSVRLAVTFYVSLRVCLTLSFVKRWKDIGKREVRIRKRINSQFKTTLKKIKKYIFCTKKLSGLFIGKLTTFPRCLKPL